MISEPDYIIGIKELSTETKMVQMSSSIYYDYIIGIKELSTET